MTRVLLQVECLHVAGPFASADDLGQELAQELDGITVQPYDSEYEVTSAEPIEAKPQKRVAPEPIRATCARCGYQGTLPVVAVRGGYGALCPSCLTGHAVTKDGRGVLLPLEAC